MDFQFRLHNEKNATDENNINSYNLPRSNLVFEITSNGI